MSGAPQTASGEPKAQFARFFLFAAAAGLTALLVRQMYLVLAIGGMTGVERAMLALFVINIAWVTSARSR